MCRREFLGASVACGVAVGQAPPTRFRLACMTLPYAKFPLERALQGVKAAGFEYVAWGTTHPDSSGKPKPVVSVDDPPPLARATAVRCRNMGLEPLMMFAMVNLEAANARDAHLRRIEQAHAAGISYVLTFGKTSGGERKAFVEALRAIAPEARQAKVTVLIKQHGGNTATGADCARILGELGDEGIRMCYDAGNVLDYENHDPIADIQTCWREVRAFAIKDHRNTPKDEDCGPGFGEIDHYKLLQPVMRTGLTIPLAFENIFEPLVPRPSTPEKVDALARRSREYIESVIRGLKTRE